MSNRIDCTAMSHTTCLEPMAPATEAAPSREPPLATAPEPSLYECVDDCISSLGVAQLVASAVTGLGCYAMLPACPVFIGGSAGAILGWCEGQCADVGAAKER